MSQRRAAPLKLPRRRDNDHETLDKEQPIFQDVDPPLI
jgi:hypothetical protein